MLGAAAVAMWWDIAPHMRAEWEEWHSLEHMPERLAIPGFLRGTRWIALSGEPSYFVQTADWILLVGGYDARAVKNAGTGSLYRPSYCLSAREVA